MEGKVAVLGSSDFVKPFSAIGADIFAVSEKTEDITKNAKKILEQNYAIIVVAEDVAPLAEQIFADVQKKPAPAVIVVPFTTESKGFATEALGHMLKIATGINILENKKISQILKKE